MFRPPQRRSRARGSAFLGRFELDHEGQGEDRVELVEGVQHDFAGRDATAVHERDFLERINKRGRVYLTATMLHGLYALRICVLSFRTHLDRMQAGIEDIRSAAAELTS